MKTSNKLIAAPIAIILLAVTILVISIRVYAVPEPTTDKAPVEVPTAPDAPAVPDTPAQVE